MGATASRLRAIADQQFGSSTPATWYLGLSVATPTPDGSGFVEPPTGVGYARVTIPNTGASWKAATTADNITRKENLAKFTFTNPTGPWGQITYWGLFLTLTGGTPEWFQALDSSISPKAGHSPVEFDVGQFWISLGGSGSGSG